MKNIIINIQNIKEIEIILKKLKPDIKPVWGNLTPHYMVEHLSSTMKYSNGKVKHKLYTLCEYLEKYRAELFADKDFPKFFKSPVFEKDLLKLNNENINEAIDELISEIEHFHKYYEQSPEIKEMHGVFESKNRNC